MDVAKIAINKNKDDPNFDQNITKFNLQVISSYPYTVGDCFFDSISYLKFIDTDADSEEREEYSDFLRKKAMEIFQEEIKAKTKMAEYSIKEIKSLFEIMKISSIDEYIAKMSVSHRKSGLQSLWANLTLHYWVTKAIQQPIYVWNKNEAGIILGRAEEYLDREQIHLVWSLEHRHIEPMIPIDSSIKISIPAQSQEIINLKNDDILTNINPIERKKKKLKRTIDNNTYKVSPYSLKEIDEGYVFGKDFFCEIPIHHVKTASLLTNERIVNKKNSERIFELLKDNDTQMSILLLRPTHFKLKDHNEDVTEIPITSKLFYQTNRSFFVCRLMA